MTLCGEGRKPLRKKEEITMIAKQCIFVDKEKAVHAGIHCVEDDGDNYIICLCCGGIIDHREVVFKDFENWMSLDELDEITEEENDKLKDLRKAESHIRAYLKNYGDIEICFDEGCQDIRNFQGVEINPLSL